jgi:hypothetical protein
VIFGARSLVYVQARMSAQLTGRWCLAPSGDLLYLGYRSSRLANASVTPMAEVVLQLR